MKASTIFNELELFDGDNNDRGGETMCMRPFHLTFPNLNSEMKYSNMLANINKAFILPIPLHES